MYAYFCVYITLVVIGANVCMQSHRYLGNELVSDVGVVEPSPEFKGHTTTTAAGSHDGALDGVGRGEGEGVPSLVGERGVGYTQGHVCTERLKGHQPSC